MSSEDAGLAVLADERLSVPTDKGANAGAKVAALVAGMVAGADAVTDPLLPHPLVARIALDRLRSALVEAPRGAAGGR